jgi:regulator of protease activity HflC (stomatin/prohibitin superfamily)
LIDALILQLSFVEYFGLFFGLIIIISLIASGVRVLREYERAVVFRLGRLIGTKGPGLIWLVPIIDKSVKVDLRVETLDVPKQKIITLDNVTIDVDAVIYLRVNDPSNAIVKVNNYLSASSLLSQTTLRNLLGQYAFDDIISKRDELNKKIQEILDAETDPWGVKVVSVNLRDVALPENMLRAIAKQAEAEREKRGRIIIADGELQAAEKMNLAANFYTKNIAALRLRELQTWTEIAREKNMIVITNKESNDLGSVLGVVKEQTSASQRLNEEIVRKIVKDEVINQMQGSESENDATL